MCANFIYDLNGNKGPNTVGKDIGFITALYPFEPNVVAPMPLANDVGYFTFSAASPACTKVDSESRLPNKDELSAMFYNKEIVGGLTDIYWSSTVYQPGETGTAWFQYIISGRRQAAPVSSSRYVRCVKR